MARRERNTKAEQSESGWFVDKDDFDIVSDSKVIINQVTVV